MKFLIDNKQVNDFLYAEKEYLTFWSAAISELGDGV